MDGVSLFWAATAALGLGATLRILRAAEADAPPPPAWQPLLLVCCCAALAAALSGGHLDGGAVDTSDFEDYCAGAAWWSEGGEGTWPRRRSRLAGLPAGLLSAPLGIIDGFVASGILSYAALAGGLYLGAAALLGPAAGGAAAVAAVGLAPLAVLTRHLTFYPVITATFALAAGLTVRAALSARRSDWLAACLLVGLCPLVDLRGIVWGGALGGLLLITALRDPARLLVLAAALAASWLAGPLAYPENAASLEEQAWQAVHLQSLAAQQARGGGGALPAFETWTVWGRSSIWALPAGLRTVAGLADAAPLRAATHAMSDLQIRLWSAAALVTGGLAAWRLRGERWRLLVLALASAPFLLAWLDAARFGRAELRQVALGAPGVALVVGAGLGALVPARCRRWWLLPLALALTLLPGAPLGPDAPWRTPTPSRQAHHITTKLRAAEQGAVPRARLGAACVGALRADRARGLPAGSRLYGELTAPPGSRPAAPDRPARSGAGSGR